MITIDFSTDSTYSLQLILPGITGYVDASLIISNSKSHIQLSYQQKEILFHLYKSHSWSCINGYIIQNGKKYPINLLNCSYQWPWYIYFSFLIHSQKPQKELREFSNIYQMDCIVKGAHNWFIEKHSTTNIFACLLDKNKNITESYTRTKYYVIENYTQASHYIIKFKNQKYNLSINTKNTPTGDQETISMNYWTQIRLQTLVPTTFSTFREIIQALQELIQILSNTNARIIPFEMRINSSVYNIYSSNLYFSIASHWKEPFKYFYDIKSKLGRYLNKWLQQRTILPLCTKAISAYRQQEAFSTQILLDQIKALENFGNTKCLARNTKDDLKAAILAVNQQDFKHLFYKKTFLMKLKGEFPFNKQLTPTLLANQLRLLRNLYIHPFAQGIVKNPADEHISPLFLTKDQQMNERSLKNLSRCLNDLLIFIICQQINL